MAKKRESVEPRITVSSTAEYFSKNLQQVGFSSPTKAVLTTLKEAVDNSLDACEENGILPDIKVLVQKIGPGSLKNTDQILVRVEDNGPGIGIRDLPKVFGEYLASSKFGKGRCSRGQQGIGISAATTWAMQTTATGVKVISKTKNQKKAISCRIQVDLKSNKGHLKDQKEVDWNRPHGTAVEFLIDGRVQLNGESGLLAFLRSNVLVNPHMSLTYKLLDDDEVVEPRVSQSVPRIPEATNPHPHTMKLGEFLGHGRLFGNLIVKDWLIKGFSRIGEGTIRELQEKGIAPKLLKETLKDLKESDFKQLFVALQDCDLLPPSTRSVLSIGEEGLAKSIQRLGELDYFSVVTRKPTICDFKPVQVEVAIARLEDRSGQDSEASVQVLRFANRVPLQFDKAGCAIIKGISTVNWKSYGLRQSRNSVPVGPYIIAVSLVSPFIKFKNASKETIDASDELVEEFRRALMQAGQRLSRHLRKEHREAILESKIQHIEQFAPILVDGLVRITSSDESRREKAHEGLLKILGREAKEAEKDLEQAETQLKQHIKRQVKKLGKAAATVLSQQLSGAEGAEPQIEEDLDHIEASELKEVVKKAKTGTGKKASKKAKKEPVKKVTKAKAEKKKKVSKKKTAAAVKKKKTVKKKATTAKAKPASKKAKTAAKAKTKAKSGTKTKVKTAAKAKTKAKSGAKTKVKTAAKAKTKAKSGAKTKVKTAAKAKTKAKSGAKTKVKTAAKAKTKAKSGAKTKAKAKAKPKTAKKTATKKKKTKVKAKK
ncbi:MAG: DNA topoisomerase VI subunit B [Oligoflexus sp.]